MNKSMQLVKTLEGKEFRATLSDVTIGTSDMPFLLVMSKVYSSDRDKPGESKLVRAFKHSPALLNSTELRGLRLKLVPQQARGWGSTTAKETIEVVFDGRDRTPSFYVVNNATYKIEVTLPEY